MNQIGQSTKKLSIFQNDHNDDNDDNDDDTHPPWIIVRVGMIFRRGQKELYQNNQIWFSVTVILTDSLQKASLSKELHSPRTIILARSIKEWKTSALRLQVGLTMAADFERSTSGKTSEKVLSEDMVAKISEANWVRFSAMRVSRIQVHLSPICRAIWWNRTTASLASTFPLRKRLAALTTYNLIFWLWSGSTAPMLKMRNNMHCNVNSYYF